MILLCVIAMIAVAVLVRLTAPRIRRRRIARELHGDWWSRFELEFRQYSDRFAQAARDAEWHR